MRTKLFYSQCRFIRFPFYIRGRKSMDGAKGLTIGRFCRFELEGYKKSLFIGDNCEMGDMTHIVALNKVEIGNNVLIASKCFISDTSHGAYSKKYEKTQSNPSESPNDRCLCCEPVIIEDNVWIGENVVILLGCSIGFGSIIGANSVVTGNIPRNSIAVGVPARVIKKFCTETQTWERI